MPTVLSFLVVFIGSGLGGMIRHGVGLIATRFGGLTFPWGTLVINVVGSALIGLVIGLFAARSISNAELRLFLTTGVIGGFTTWSTVSLDVVTLWERGEPYMAVFYMAASLILSLAALAAVLIAARQWSWSSQFPLGVSLGGGDDPSSGSPSLARTIFSSSTISAVSSVVGASLPVMSIASSILATTPGDGSRSNFSILDVCDTPIMPIFAAIGQSFIIERLSQFMNDSFAVLCARKRTEH